MMRSWSRRSLFGAMALGVWALVAVAATPALAGEVSASGRNVQTVEKVEWLEVGDQEGHVVGIYRSKGLTFHGDGEISTTVNHGTFDYVKGAGSHEGYLVRTFDDDSTMTVKYQGTTKHDAAGRVTQGTASYATGTGRYEGIEGDGSYSGRLFGNGMSIADWQSKYTLPD